VERLRMRSPELELGIRSFGEPWTRPDTAKRPSLRSSSSAVPGARSEDLPSDAILELCRKDFRATTDRLLSSAKHEFVRVLGPDRIRAYVARASQSSRRPEPSRPIPTKWPPHPQAPLAHRVVEEEEDEEETKANKEEEEEEDAPKSPRPSLRPPAREPNELVSWDGGAGDKEGEPEHGGPSPTGRGWAALPFEFAGDGSGELPTPPRQRQQATVPAGDPHRTLPVNDDSDDLGRMGGIFGSDEMQRHDSSPGSVGSDQFEASADNLQLPDLD
jgi:hypothetical protein